MSNIADILFQGGVLDKSVLREFGRWGKPVDVSSEDPVVDRPTARSMTETVKQLVDALEDREMSFEQQNDLDALRAYEKTAKKATLYLAYEDGKKSRLTVEVGTTVTGDILIPWTDDSIIEEMTNGYTYLKLDDQKLWFSMVRDIAVGDQRMFMLCTPGTDVEEEEDV